MSRTFPEEHLQRLELAARAVELTPTDPLQQPETLRTGLAGEVPLQLALRKDGTLELQAQSPHPLPEELRIERDPAQGVQVHAANPAIAKRLWAQGEVRRRLEALFDAVPQARVSDGAVLLELAPELKEDQLKTALRATLRATQALSEASQELTRAAELKRDQVRSTAVPEELEGGRRFVKLLPGPSAKQESTVEREQRLLGEATDLFLQGATDKEVLAHIQREISNPFISGQILKQAARADPRHQKQGMLTLFITLGWMASAFAALNQLHLLQHLPAGRSYTWIVVVPACLSVYGIHKGLGWYLDRRDAKKKLSARNRRG